MDGNKDKPKLPVTPQEAGFAQWQADVAAVLEKHGASLNELDATVREKLIRQLDDVAKLRDDVDSVRTLAREQFKALADHYHRGGNYRGPFASYQDAESFGKLCVAMFRNDRAQLAELQKMAVTPGIGAQGGFLLAEQFINTLLVSLESYGVVGRNAFVPPGIGGQAASIPKLTTGATTYYPDEGVAPTESSLAFAQVKVGITRYSTYALVDRWLLNTNAYAALGDFIAAELARAHAYAEDRNGLVGDGTSAYARCIGLFRRAGTNQLTVTADTGDDTFAEVCDATVKYLGAVAGSLPQWAEAFDPRWYMHKSIFFRYLGARTTSTNAPIANIFNVSGVVQNVLMSYPVEISQVCPRLADTAASTVMCILAALRRALAIVRHRAGMELRISDQVKFLEGQVAFVLDCPQDVVELDNQAYVQLKTAAS